MDEQDWVTTTKAAELLQISAGTANRWAHKYDDTFAYRIGGRFRVRKSAIYQILKTGVMPPLRETSTDPELEAHAHDPRQNQLFR